MKQHILMTEKAIIIQKYARVWLAKRYVNYLQEQEHKRQKELLNQVLNEMKDEIRTCGSDSKEQIIKSAVVIQKYARGIFIRKLLAPYFSLFRRVNPLVYALSNINDELG